MISLVAAAKRNNDGTFDAEVSLTFYAADASILFTTGQRTVLRGLESREAATASAKAWLQTTFFPAFAVLPEAKA